MSTLTSSLRALAIGAALLAAACDEKKSDAPASTPTAAPTPSAAKLDATATASASAAPAASSAPAAASSAAPDAAPGENDLTLGDVKATKGKVDNPQRKFRANLTRARNKCLLPGLKKDATASGSVKYTIELDADGKPKKVTSTTEGKVPDALVACLKTYIEKEIEFDDKATLEATFSIGPKKADEAKKDEKK